MPCGNQREAHSGDSGGDSRAGDPRGCAAAHSRDHRLSARLSEHAASVRLGKGVLSLFLVITDRARNQGLPLEPAKLLTAGEGQIKGLGKGAVQTILERHGITEVLAQEGGRTNQASPGNMRA